MDSLNIKKIAYLYDHIFTTHYSYKNRSGPRNKWLNIFKDCKHITLKKMYYRRGTFYLILLNELLCHLLKIYYTFQTSDVNSKSLYSFCLLFYNFVLFNLMFVSQS